MNKARITTLHLLFVALTGCRLVDPSLRELDRGWAALEAGELDRAQAAGEAVLDREPPLKKIERGRAEALALLGAVAARRGDLPLSVNLLTESVSFDPEREDAQSMLGDGQRALGLADEAIRSYEHAVQLDHDDPRHQIALCEVYLELYQQDAARPRCAKALELAPADPRALGADALVRARDGDVAGAEARLTAAQGLDEASRADLRRRIAMARVEGPGRTLLTRIDQEDRAFSERVDRRVAALNRAGPTPPREDATSAPSGAEPVLLPAEPGPLRAWLRRPSAPPPWPAVVYLHAGFALGQADVDASTPFVEAGYAVLLPTLRGEPGNPGVFELFHGEVLDVEAALYWLRQQPEILPERVSLFGDREGGALAGLVHGATRTGSYGALYPEQEFVRWDLPFELDNREGRRQRAWVHQLAALPVPHHAFVSARDPLASYAEELRSDAAALGAPLTVTEIPGDPALARDAAIRAFLAELGPAR